MLTLLAVSTFSSVPVAEANFEGFQSNCQTDVSGSDTKKDDPDDDGTSDSGGSAGTWDKKGTKSHEIAQNMWNYWKGKGFNGSAIAGVMGNVDHEGGFELPDRAEGHFGSDEKSNGISEGNVPATGAGYPVGKSGKVEGGAGHYQFTPYSKFASVGDKKWKSTEKQSDFVWSSEVQKASWLKSYINSDSVNSAVETWFSKYERGAALNPAKVTSAKKAYQVFGGKDVKADSALANATDTANTGQEESAKSEKDADGCADQKDSGTNPDNASAGDIVSSGKKLVGYFSYVQSHSEANIGSIKKPKKDGITDCSGFVWLVLAQTGYKVPKDMGWYTKTMEDDAKSDHKWLKEIPKKDAKAGDIVIVNTGSGAGNNGHTAIITEGWKDKSDKDNDTKIVQMGGSLADNGVNQSKFNQSFTSLLTGDYSITMARPIKK